MEELFFDYPWQLLLSTILLNKTTRAQVDPVLCELLDKWPTPNTILRAEVESIAKIIRPLGLQDRRSAGIIQFTRDYVNKVQELGNSFGDLAPFKMTRKDILSLHHCGEYAYSAYCLFILRSTSDIQSTDHALVAYAEYQRGLNSDLERESHGAITQTRCRQPQFI
uniref:HhH-GPD domain-containing protein n=1 Tax=Entomoneis paludosa TaxID=265537 RepID=A0A7S2Y680_9STRA